MNTNSTTAVLALLLFVPTLACDVERAPLDSAELEALPTLPAAEATEIDSWEAQKLGEADAELLVEHAEQLGFALVEDLSFAYPVDGIALAELSGPREAGFLSFDFDAEGTTLATMLVLSEQLAYEVVDGEVVPVVAVPGAATQLSAGEAPVDNECHSWGNCGCAAFALAVAACSVVHEMYSESFYNCVRGACS